MTIDGEPVVRVVLWTRADVGPLRHQLLPQTVVVERFDHTDRGPSREEELLEQRARLRGPRLRRWLSDVAQPVERRSLDRQITLRGRHRDPQHEERVLTRPCSFVDADLPIDARRHRGSRVARCPHRDPRGPWRPDRTRRQVSSLIHAMDRAASAIRRMTTSPDASPSALATMGWSCNVSTLMARPCRTLQLDTGVEQHGVRGIQARARRSRTAPDRDASAHFNTWHVAHAAASLLEVRLEKERNLACTRMPAATRRSSSASHRREARVHCAVARSANSSTGSVSPAIQPRAEQRRGCVEIVAGEAQGLTDGAHAVAELQTRVPDRVPDPVGERFHVDLLVVHQQQVDVAGRAQLGTAVTADRARARHLNVTGSRRRTTTATIRPRALRAAGTTQLP